MYGLDPYLGGRLSFYSDSEDAPSGRRVFQADVRSPPDRYTDSSIKPTSLSNGWSKLAKSPVSLELTEADVQIANAVRKLESSPERSEEMTDLRIPVSLLADIVMWTEANLDAWAKAVKIVRKLSHAVALPVPR